MPPQAKPLVFVLNADELSTLRAPVGTGGFQSFHRAMQTQLAATGNVVKLDPVQFGTLLRYMSQYGQGGFQTRLHRAFKRSVRDLLHV